MREGFAPVLKERRTFSSSGVSFSLPCVIADKRCENRAKADSVDVSVSSLRLGNVSMKLTHLVFGAVAGLVFAGAALIPLGAPGIKGSSSVILNGEDR